MAKYWKIIYPSGHTCRLIDFLLNSASVEAKFWRQNVHLESLGPWERRLEVFHEEVDAKLCAWSGIKIDLIPGGCLLTHPYSSVDQPIQSSQFLYIFKIMTSCK